MARAAVPVPDDPREALAAAYTRGLRLLGARELSEAAIRRRLLESGFPPVIIDAAVARLLDAGALNEQRAVLAVARTLVQVKRRGRLRAVRELEARGFPPDIAQQAVGHLIVPDDERALVERALDAKLRGRPVTPGDAASMRRLLAALVRQGHPPSLVRAAIRDRFRNAARAIDEDDTE